MSVPEPIAVAYFEGARALDRPSVDVSIQDVRVKMVCCPDDVFGLNVIAIEPKPDHPLYQDLYLRWVTRFCPEEQDSWPKDTKPVPR